MGAATRIQDPLWEDVTRKQVQEGTQMNPPANKPNMCPWLSL